MRHFFGILNQISRAFEGSLSPLWYVLGGHDSCILYSLFIARSLLFHDFLFTIMWNFNIFTSSCNDNDNIDENENIHGMTMTNMTMALMSWISLKETKELSQKFADVFPWLKANHVEFKLIWDFENWFRAVYVSLKHFRCNIICSFCFWQMSSHNHNIASILQIENIRRVPIAFSPWPSCIICLISHNI